MTTKSDFAQKLLHDLRLRKERMGASQSTSRQSSQSSSRVIHGNSGQTSRSARRINALESGSSTSRRSNGGSRSVNIKESSNQIVLYESGHSSKQVRDLSMAIAFAFENSGNLSKIGGSSSNPLVNFFNRFGRRSLNSQKMDITGFDSQSISTSQFPNVSHIHITEISKGVHNLNQILRACSNGLNFDRNSIEVGRELLKGAIDLEESLRMLANLQEGSQFVNGSQKKSRLKLLDEDEDYQDDNNNKPEQWKLDRPSFSFDRRSRNSHLVQGETRQQHLALLPYTRETSEQALSNSKLVPHKRSSSYVQDLSASTLVKLNNNSSSSQSKQEKGRISNVIAKLMGLEEIPTNEDSKCMKNDPKDKETKVSREHTKFREPSTRESRNGSISSTNKMSSATNNTPHIRESKLQLKTEKSRGTPDGSSKMVNTERNPLRKELKIPAVAVEAAADPKLATIVTDNQRSHTSGANIQSFEDSKSKVIETHSEMLVLNTDQKKKAQNSKTRKAAHTRHSSIEQELTANSLERRNVNKDHPSNQQKPQDQHTLHQEQVPKRAEHLEDKHQLEQKGQQIQKQNLMAKNHEGQQLESTVASKSKSTAINTRKKLSGDKSAPGNRRLRPSEKVPIKSPPNSKHQDAALMIDIAQKTASGQENVKKEDQTDNSSTRDPEIDNGSSIPLLMKENPIEVSATQQRSIARKVQRKEIPQKIDVLITRRNATVNHLERSLKKPANMLKDLKQQMHNKNRTYKKTEEQTSKLQDGKTGISVHNMSEMTSDSMMLKDDLQNEVDETFNLHSTAADESQIQNTLSLNGNSEAIVLKSGKVLDDIQTVEQSCVHKDEDHKQCDPSIGAHEESKELYNLSQHGYNKCPTSQLTEPEKHLKEAVIKSQLFLSTAEALFKLNIPVSFLHAGDHNNEAAEMKLIVDCAYEVMKRKARRHEAAHHPYISSSKVRSLDVLVKQLCKDLEMLKMYGMNGSEECDVAAGLHKMLNKDIYNETPDVNSMWDFEWNKMMSVMEDVIKDVETQILNGLLDDITNDLLLITVVPSLFQ